MVIIIPDGYSSVEPINGEDARGYRLEHADKIRMLMVSFALQLVIQKFVLAHYGTGNVHFIDFHIGPEERLQFSKLIIVDLSFPLFGNVLDRCHKKPKMPRTT
jgi:hypothetical protein